MKPGDDAPAGPGDPGHPGYPGSQGGPGGFPAGTAPPPATILPAVRWATDVLRRGRIDEAGLNAELLMCHVLGCDRISLYLHFEKILGRAEVDRFIEAVRRRLGHEPLQYITGETSFMGMRIAVDRRVLIPRPETETLVERSLSFLRERGEDRLDVLDVGAGSGNIAVAIARFHPGVRITAVDVSAEALALAAANVRSHTLHDRVSLVRADVLRDPLPFAPGSFDAIVSNPPYIPSAEVDALQPEVRLFEPPLATTDGADGLSFFRTIARIAPGLLKAGGGVFVETGYNQAPVVGAIFHAAGFGRVDATPDLAGIERVVGAQR